MIGSSQPLATRYDVALLDLDGVVYIGEQPVPGAPQALEAARRAGMRLAFVTNNASRTPHQVAELLHRVGVPADPAEVVTSAQAAAHYLADRLPAGAPVLVLGTAGLIEALAERGLTPVFSADDDPAAVVQGFSPGTDWPALAEAAVAIGRGVPWLASNLDATVPSPRGPLPGNGSLVAALRHATGTAPAAATGKPDPTMHAESVERSGARNPVVVGDRLDTDIESARRTDCPSLLVLTGVTDPARLLAAPPLHRPDYLGRDVSALLHGHPEVTETAGLVSCGTARVRTAGAELVLSTGEPGGSDSPDGLDGLRALAVAGWRLADAGTDTGTQAVRIRGGDEPAVRLLDQLGLGHAAG
ncbi:HAD-IIA family hydrolase [Jatrophihabitans sp.]|uniref:HAD-IIA family hydrolase n=1 Tax=Jatrophihabitans sp. TaxID=1932789 RepID=UPI002B8F12B4|nr:HAD-IIA family hydrolase [Jatrophihabitans sp.]